MFYETCDLPKLEPSCNVSTIKHGNQNTVEPLLKGPLFSTQLLSGSLWPISETKCQLYTVIKTSIEWPPLLSGHSHLAIPRVILCFYTSIKNSVLCHFVTSVCKTSAVHRDNDFSNRQLFELYHRCRKQMHYNL